MSRIAARRSARLEARVGRLTLERLPNPYSAVKWEVSDDVTGTEHRRLSFVVSTSSPDPLPSNRIRVKDLNLIRFRDVLSERLGGMAHEAWLEGRSSEEYVSEMISIIQESCNASKKGRTNRKRAVPWWNSSLTIARKRVLVARRRFKRCTEDLALRKEYEIAFRKHHSKFKQLVRRAKRNFCGKYLSEVEPLKPFGPYFEWIKGLSSNRVKLSAIVKEDGSPTVDFGEL